MIYKTIQGTRVPALGFGTWQLNGSTCKTAVADALEIGYRHVDTAQAYENEEEVGYGIRLTGVDRDELFLTTKIWMENLAPKDVGRSVEESLRRLGTPYVDLLLIHWPSDDVPLEDTLDAMMALQEAGKTRHVGVSNFTPRLLRRALDHAPIFCNQVEYHPFLSQDGVHTLARRHDLMLTAYSPIARGAVAEDETIGAIAHAYKKTPVQVTLRWLLQQPNVVAIPKAASTAHREANLDLFDFELTDDDMERITALSRGQRLIDPSFAPAWGE